MEQLIIISSLRCLTLLSHVGMNLCSRSSVASLHLNHCQPKSNTVAWAFAKGHEVVVMSDGHFLLTEPIS